MYEIVSVIEPGDDHDRPRVRRPDLHRRRCVPEVVARIISAERPDALLPTLAGRRRSTLAKDLHDNGTLERFGVELIGADFSTSIHRAEDRDVFRQTMEVAGLRVPWSLIAESVEDAEAPALATARWKLPAIIRPAFTMGGQGGGAARTETEIGRSSPRAWRPVRSTGAGGGVPVGWESSSSS